MKNINLAHPLFIILIFLAIQTTGCNVKKNKSILFINSYHEGYPSSDDITGGIMETLEGKDVDLEIFYMDTKRHPEKKEVDKKIKEVLQRIKVIAPDLVIASDDNAVGLVVKPYLDRTDTPVVFCGVNWSAARYELGNNVTGMLEVLPLRECIQTVMQQDPGIRRLAVLSENSQSERNNTALLDTLYQNLGLAVEYHLVDDFEQWEQAFKEVSATSDLIYLPTNGAIRNWDREKALTFVEGNLKIPTITCDDFMMDYCVFGLTKVAREQGVWAAETALEILGGTSPEDIPLARNSQWRTYLNSRLASVIGFSLLTEPGGDCEQKTDPVWVMENGVAIVEIEHVVQGGASPGYWEKLTSPSGYTGDCAFIWKGDGNMYMDPLARDASGTGLPYTLSYKIWVPEAGEYEIKLHNYHHMKDGDNDAWISINNGLYEKIWDHDVEVWSWNEAIAWEKGYQPRELLKGINTIEITGRSKAWAIDRMAICKKGIPEANWNVLDLAESPIASRTDDKNYILETEVEFQVPGAACISWVAAPFPGIASSYQVMLNDVLLGSTHLDWFSVNGLSPGEDNRITVQAMDGCGNLGVLSDALLISDRDVNSDEDVIISYFNEPCVIDGCIDKIWSRTNSYELANNAVFSLGWDKSSLYILLITEDDMTTGQINLYLDPDYSRDPYLSINDRWYLMEPGKEKITERLNRDVNALGASIASITLGSESIMEASIPWERLQALPLPDLMMGLEIILTTSDPENKGTHKTGWFPHNHSTNPVPAQFGAAVLDN